MDLATATMVTARLRLEPIGPRHAEDLRLLYQDPVVATWNGGTWSKEEAESYARACQQGWQTEGVHKWMAYDRRTGALVGRGGLSRMASRSGATVQIKGLLDRSSWANNRLEVGWALLSHQHGQGYATEIGREALRVARDILGTAMVICFTEVHNAASRAVAERLGMTFVGEIRAEGLVEGQQEVADDAPFAVYVIERETA
jgi:RimJ/RimL family protein N-acetyltransferase